MNLHKYLILFNFLVSKHDCFFEVPMRTTDNLAIMNPINLKFFVYRFTLPLLTAFAMLSVEANAANYPNRPLRMLVTNAPGSSVDTLTRIVSLRLGMLLGQQVVVDNRPGAASVVGMEIAKNANADGYTLISAPTAALSVAPLLYKKLPYDTLNDFAYISLFAITPNVLVVTPSLPVKSVKDLIELAKTKNGQLNMASSGNGSQSHLTSALLTSLGKFESLHVPYKSGGASVAAIIAGESNWMVTPAPAVWGMVKSGRLRAVAHSMAKRTPLLGDLPAINESVPGYDYSGWNGLLAPRGTPQPMLSTVRDALLKAMAMPEVKDALAAQATEVAVNTPEEFRALAKSDLEKYGQVVRAIGLKAE